jgi:hypothetical protein
MGVQGDWGQGAANNDIFWGQAAATNSISWGMVQPLSYGHPTTNLFGGSGQTAWQLIEEIWNTWEQLGINMGTTLTGTTPQDTYDSLIKVTDNGPLSGTLKALSDGLGNDSTLSLSTTAASIAGTLSVTGNATFDTSTLFVDAAANEVGIGTITPSAKLDVDGTSYVIVANNSLGNRKIKFGVDGVAGEPTIQAALSDDTARQLLINPEGGNVGIGTSSPAAGYSLSVVGAFGAAVGGAYVEVGEFDRSLMILNHSNPSVNANLFQVQKSGTGVFTINPAGNVGIGTSAPSVRLQANTTSTTNAIIAAVVNPSAADNITKAASISFGLADTVGFGKEVAYLRAFTDGGNVVSGGLAIDVRKADNTPSEIARFTKDGLTFNGDTAAANALDDYEEGTFTPTVSFGGTVCWCATYGGGHRDSIPKIGRSSIF